VLPVGKSNQRELYQITRKEDASAWFCHVNTTIKISPRYQCRNGVVGMVVPFGGHPSAIFHLFFRSSIMAGTGLIT